MVYTKNPKGRKKPETMALRVTPEVKLRFILKAREEGKNIQEKLEELVMSYLKEDLKEKRTKK